MNVDGSDQRRLTHNDFSDEAPHFSPEGSQIATESGQPERRQIHVMNANGSDHRPLTDRDAYHGYPTWSPDGNRIAFDSTLEGDPHIFVMNVDGSDVHRVTSTPGINLFANWVTGGREILYISLTDGAEEDSEQGDLFIVDVASGKTRRITDTPYAEAAPSCRGC